MLRFFSSLVAEPGTVKAVPGFLLLALCLTGCGDEKPEPQKAETQTGQKEFAPLDRSLVTYERGRYYTPSVTNDAARSFAELTEDEKRRAEEVRKALRSAGSIDEIQQQLADARTLESAALLDVVDDLLKHDDPLVRTLALTLIEGINSPELARPLRDAFADPSADVRIQAMEVAQHVVDPALCDLLLNMMDDEHISVRQLALQSARNQGEDFAEHAINRAATSPKEDMAMAGLALIESNPSKRTIGIVMRGLDHQSAKVREQAHEMLFLATHQSFKSRAEAQAWWKQYQAAFDDSLVITDAEQFIKR